MPRRRPSTIGAAQPARRQIDAPRTHPRRISGKFVAAVVRLERHHNHLRPGDVLRALRTWLGNVRGPARQLVDDFGGCPCGCTLDHREVLDIALASLPTKAARELRSIVDAADQLFVDRTLPDLWADPGDPWWKRRM
jgi:hypothetical protein